MSAPSSAPLPRTGGPRSLTLVAGAMLAIGGGAVITSTRRRHRVFRPRR